MSTFGFQHILTSNQNGTIEKYTKCLLLYSESDLNATIIDTIWLDVSSITI